MFTIREHIHNLNTLMSTIYGIDTHMYVMCIVGDINK